MCPKDTDCMRFGPLALYEFPLGHSKREQCSQSGEYIDWLVGLVQTQNVSAKQGLTVDVVTHRLDY